LLKKLLSEYIPGCRKKLSTPFLSSLIPSWFFPLLSTGSTTTQYSSFPRTVLVLSPIIVWNKKKNCRIQTDVYAEIWLRMLSISRFTVQLVLTFFAFRTFLGNGCISGHWNNCSFLIKNGLSLLLHETYSSAQINYIFNH